MSNVTSSALVEACTFENNKVRYASGAFSYCHGGGMYNRGSAPVVRGCVFSGNSTRAAWGSSYGGGMYNANNAATRVENTLFVANLATYGGGSFANTFGGGACNVSSTAQYINCTFTKNAAIRYDAPSRGGAMYSETTSPTLRNCIVWGNTAGTADNEIGGTVLTNVTYSCVREGFYGDGNIALDPLFADSAANDFHIFSEAGRWTSGGWVLDAQTSPCIDAGNPSDAFSIEPEPNGTQVNMGAYGNTEQASKSPRAHHSIEASSTGGGSTIPSGAILVADGMDFSFSIVPEAGYAVQDVLVDGVSVGPLTQYTFEDVLADHTIEASFTLGLSITATAGAGGTITPSGAILVAPGNDASFMIKANVGYRILDVLVDGLSRGPLASYEFADVQTAHSIAASFEAAPYLVVSTGTIARSCHNGASPSSATFTVRNAGTGTLDYTVYDDADWLTCLPASGSSTGELDTITISFDTALLPIGQHVGHITVAGTGENCPQVVSVAVTIYSGVIYVNQATSGNNDGSSWLNAFTDLQAALQMAQSGDAIWVAQGAYKPTSGSNRATCFQMKSNVAVYGGFSGGESDLNERNVDAHATVLSGDLGAPGNYIDNSYHVVKGANGARLDGFTITGGHASGTDAADDGAGMLNTSCTPVIANCTFTQNKCTGYYGRGGAIFNDHAASTITHCRFIGNKSSGIYTLGGGAVYNESCAPTIENSYFESNSCSGYNAYGGGIKNDNASPHITSCVFLANNAAEGAGIENWESSAPVIVNCVFHDNNGASGVAIDNDAAGLTGGTASIINCTFYNNDPSALVSKNSATATITNCILAGGDQMTGTNVVTYTNTFGQTIAGAGNLNVDPLFMDATAGDLRLQGSSPCLDTGSNVPFDSSGIVEGVVTDAEGNQRIVDGNVDSTATVDMGAFEAQEVPGAPTDAAVQSVSTDSISWQWQDNADNETGFKVWADPGSAAPTTLQAVIAADSTEWNYTGLTPNTRYAFQVTATNGGYDSARANSISRYTLAQAPSIGNSVACDKSLSLAYPAGTTFVFSNPAGFGEGVHGGSAYSVSGFRYAWNDQPTHTFAGTESEWNSDTLSQVAAGGSASYYLHLQSLNVEGVSGGTLDYGPFVVDADPPGVNISLSGTTPTAADSLTFNIAFTESIGTSFSLSDMQLASGSLSGTLQLSGSDPNFTVSVTLGNPEADGNIAIEIPAGAVSDTAGNPGTAGASLAYIVWNWKGFTTTPTSADLYAGASHTLQVAGNWAPIAPTFQWKREVGGKAIEDGPTTSTWLIENVVPAEAGEYWCVVTYDGVPYVSEAADLRIAEHLWVSALDDQVRRERETCVFTVSTTGGFMPLSYFWKKNGENIEGASNTSYETPPLSLSDSGAVYTVEVIDANGDEVSESAEVTVTEGLPLTNLLGILVIIISLLVIGAERIVRRSQEV